MSVDEAKIINQTITRLLSMREHSQFELLRKLAVKGHCQLSSENQLQLFIEKGIQSDQRYLESYVRSAYLKGKGPQVIRQVLKQHNIEGTHVSEHIKNEDYDWYSLAAKVRNKRFGEILPCEGVAKLKQMRFLQYRGFEKEHIKAAFE